jgi:hypothetical protein
MNTLRTTLVARRARRSAVYAYGVVSLAVFTLAILYIGLVALAVQSYN